MGERKPQEVIKHCDILGEFAFDVFSGSQHAMYMAALEEQGSGVAFGEVAVHTRFSMSYSAYESMKLYYFANLEALKSDAIDSFLRCYGEFSKAFSGNWVATVGIEVACERFERFEASYHALQTVLRTTRERCSDGSEAPSGS